MGKQLWIANSIEDVANIYGIRVVREPGWKTRGSSNFNPQGVILHHTATRIVSGNPYPTRQILKNGHGSLPGPLCNVGIARNGDIYIVAAGRANHAGRGKLKGFSGNRYWFGIEAENDGRGEKWNPEILRSYYLVTAVLLDGVGRNYPWAGGHKEYAPTRKVDPRFNTVAFRTQVMHAMRGTSAVVNISRDWFDMATEAQLRKVVQEEVVKAWGYEGNEDRDAWSILRRIDSNTQNVGELVWGHIFTGWFGTYRASTLLTRLQGGGIDEVLAGIEELKSRLDR